MCSCGPNLNIVATLLLNDLLPLLLLVIDAVGGLAAFFLALVLDAIHLAAVEVARSRRLLGGLGCRHGSTLVGGLGLALLAVIDAIAALVLVVAAATPASILTTAGTLGGAAGTGRVIRRITGSGGRGRRSRGGAWRSAGSWGAKRRASSRGGETSGRAWTSGGRGEGATSLGCNGRQGEDGNKRDLHCWCSWTIVDGDDTDIFLFL